MSFPAYPTYKDSGVEWICAIPQGWTVRRLSLLFKTVSSGTTPPTDMQHYYDGEVPWVTTGELRESLIRETEKGVSRAALRDLSALKVYPAGALLIALYGATIGRLGILGLEACTNQACCAMAYPIDVDSAFVFYSLMAAREHLLLIASGGGQPNINQEKLRALRLPIPPVPEQSSITSFLDRETGKIDALVAEQERLMALLKEKRQAVITQAVTKGLNPNAKMKDSGVEGLGQVPEHWQVGTLKRFWIVIDCKHVTAEFVEDGIPLASIREVQGRFVNLDTAKKLP